MWRRRVFHCGHSDGILSIQPLLVLQQLVPEAGVQPDVGAALLHPVVRLAERHPSVTHQVRHHQRRRAAHPHGAVHQCAAGSVEMDALGYAVEVVPEASAGQVGHRNSYTLHPRVGGAGVADRGIDDQGDAFLRHQRRVEGAVGPAEEQGGGDLRDRHEADLSGNTWRS